MKILLTNDDGYFSVGLQLLCSELARFGEVYVVAPDGQRSGFSHAMNYNKNITLKKLSHYCDAKSAYVCSGTPADCVRIAKLMLGVQFDLLVAGPNNGANYGRLLLCSGTVGAAEEGTLCGIKSIALSRLGRGGSFYATIKYLSDNIVKLYEAIEPNMFLNINVPDLPVSEIKGVKVRQHSVELPSFSDACEAMDENTVKIIGKRNPLTAEDCDVTCACDGYITISPLGVSRTKMTSLSNLGRLEQ